jgi:Ca-activated chloride channel family protein
MSAVLLYALSTPAHERLAAQQRSTPLIIDDTFVVVPVPVSVTDDDGRFIAGLTKEDFELLEDGQPQEIATFSHDKAPLTTILLVDTSGSMNSSLPAVKTAAMRYIKALGPDDRTKVVQFNERVVPLEDFTSDKPKLEAAIGRLQTGGATALLNALYTALSDLNARRKALDKGKRAVIVLSDGDDTASALSDDMIVRAAQRSEAVIYCVRLQPERRDLQQPESVDDLEGTRFLEDLATETGGRLLLTPLRRLDRVYEEVADELRNQYTLGYLSTNTTRDAKFRRLTVRVKGKRNFRIRHKPGYYAAR